MSGLRSVADLLPQVHADASNFRENVTKEEAYDQVLQQAVALFDGQRNWVSSSCPPIARTSITNDSLGLVRLPTPASPGQP